MVDNAPESAEIKQADANRAYNEWQTLEVTAEEDLLLPGETTKVKVLAEYSSLDEIEVADALADLEEILIQKMRAIGEGGIAHLRYRIIEASKPYIWSNDAPNDRQAEARFREIALDFPALVADLAERNQNHAERLGYAA